MSIATRNGIAMYTVISTDYYTLVSMKRTLFTEGRVLLRLGVRGYIVEYLLTYLVLLGLVQLLLTGN